MLVKRRFQKSGKIRFSFISKTHNEEFGVTKYHSLSRHNERIHAVSLEELIEGSYSYNPQTDELPTNLTNFCSTCLQKVDSDGIPKRFLINEEHNTIIVLKYNKFFDKFKPYRIKPKNWIDWSIVTMYKEYNGIKIQDYYEPIDKMKVGNTYFYCYDINGKEVISKLNKIIK